MLAASALASTLAPIELPPPDRDRLGTYHSDPLLSPHLDLSFLGGLNDRGERVLYGLAEFRMGGTFALGLGASDAVLTEGPTVSSAWRIVSYHHLWSLDAVLRIPVLLPQAISFGVGGDLSPRRDGRFGVRVRAVVDTGGFAGELGLVVRAL